MAEKKTRKPASKKAAAAKAPTSEGSASVASEATPSEAAANEASSAVKNKIRESLMSKGHEDSPSGGGSGPGGHAAAASAAMPAWESDWQATSEVRLGARKSTPKEISHFLRQLATLQSAGLPLLKSLKILERRTHTAELRATCAAIVQDLERGSQLWAAFAKHPDHFNRMVVNVIRTGEESGSLVTVMDYLARYRDHEEDVKRNVEQAVMYPLVMLVVAIGVMIVLLMTVIPQFAESYEHLGVQLPWVTRVLFGISDGMKWFFLFVFLGIALLFWVNRQAVSSSGGIRHVIDRIRIKMPVFGPIMTKVYVVQFTTMLSILLKSGLPLLRSLDLVRDTTSNTMFGDAFAYIRDNVERGRTLEESFKPFPFFPPMVLDMIAVGEEAGSLPEVLDQVAINFQKEVDHDAAVVGKLLEPFMLLLLGGFVLFVALSLFMPYFYLMPAVN